MATQPLTVPYDLERVRQDFAILNTEHSPGKPLVYLDNAASSQRPDSVIEAMSNYYRTTHANVHRGIHKLSEDATAMFESARRKVAHFINASEREIIYTRGTTESINLVVNSWGRANLKPGDVVLSTVMEHHANIVPWQILSQQVGFDLKFIPITPDGRLDLVAYHDLLRDFHVKMVSVVHGSNVLGTINPVEEIIQAAHNAGALVLVDAAQSVPHMPVDVRAMDVDFLAFSGHKMIGPTGIGVLYGKASLLEDMPPFMGGGEMIDHVTLEGSTWNEIPHRFEPGTPSIAEAVGLGAAVDYLEALGMQHVHSYEAALIQYAMDRLEEVPGLRVYGPGAEDRCGLASFTVEGIDSSDLAQMLDAEGIAVRSGLHCAEPLHHTLGLGGSARASFYLYTTQQEIDKLIDGIYQTKMMFGA